MYAVVELIVAGSKPTAAKVLRYVSFGFSAAAIITAVVLLILKYATTEPTVVYVVRKSLKSL